MTVMQLQHVPRIFWWSISVSIFVVAIGFTVIAWRSSTISVEIANAKINLHQTIVDNREILQQLKELAKDLEKAKTEMQNKIAALEVKSNTPRIDELKAYKLLLDEIKIPTKAISDTSKAQEKIETKFSRDILRRPGFFSAGALVGEDGP
jgi:hypothetical protein